jgi:hypothetical protein
MMQNFPTLTTPYHAARQAFNNAIKKVDRFFYDDPMEKWVRLEVDVTVTAYVNSLGARLGEVRRIRKSRVSA